MEGVRRLMVLWQRQYLPLPGARQHDVPRISPPQPSNYLCASSLQQFAAIPHFYNGIFSHAQWRGNGVFAIQEEFEEG